MHSADYGVVQQAAMGGLLQRPADFGGAHKMYMHLHKIAIQTLQALINVHAIFSCLHTAVMHIFEAVIN